MYPSIESLPPCLKVTLPWAMLGSSRTLVSGCFVCELTPCGCETLKLATVAVALMRKDLLPVRLLSHVAPKHIEFHLQVCRPTNVGVDAAARITAPSAAPSKLRETLLRSRPTNFMRSEQP